MKQMLLLVVLAVTGIACTEDRTGPSSGSEASPPPRPGSSASPPETSTPDADIYAAVLRQLASDKHLARRAEVIYVVDGAIADAGKPRGNPFGPAPEGFGPEVVAGIRNQVAGELPPLRFLDDGTQALRHPDRPGPVKNDGVLISLGPVDPAKRRVEVAHTLWCGGKCSQWQTYVVSHRKGRWVVTGSSGSVTAS